MLSLTQEIQLLTEFLKVTQPDQLGKGFDAERGLLPYTKLELKHVWRLEHSDLWQKYETGRRQVVGDLNILQKGAGEQSRLSTKLHTTIQSLLQEADVAAGGTMLLHGTKPEFVLPIMHRGMNERLTSGEAAFGSGIYLCEDPEKMDQYCRAASGVHAQALQKALSLLSPGHAPIGNLEARRNLCNFHVLHVPWKCMYSSSRIVFT